MMVTMSQKKSLQAMTYPIRIDDHQLRISASLGIARYPEDGMSMNELLSAADSAMYAAKHQGKPGLQIHSGK